MTSFNKKLAHYVVDRYGNLFEFTGKEQDIEWRIEK